MGFQPGNKLSPGRPKGSKRAEPIKQIKDTVARKGFDLGLRLIEMIDDEKIDPAVKLKAIQLLAQYTQRQPTPEDFVTPEDEDNEATPTKASTGDLVALVKS